MTTLVNSNPLEVPKQGAVSDPGHNETAPAASDSTWLERVFNSAAERDWCELVRDVAAIANSGGGQITLRYSVQQSPANAFSESGAPIAAGDILQRIAQFTDSSFSDIRVHAAKHADGQSLRIGRSVFPIVFTKPSDYFGAGSVYFWNGQTSEPATSSRLQSSVERLLRRVRRRWLAGIRRVLKQPAASMLRATPPASRKHRASHTEASLQPVRIVTDPNAPALQPQDVDRLYPLRQKDLVAELNRRLGRRALNSYDIQAVRRQHRLDERPDFVFHLPGAGRRYSPAVMEWIMDQFERDPEFFRKARMADNEMLKLRRQKPR